MTSPRRQILLVEDDDSHAELISRCFAMAPLPTTIHRCSDGEQAVQLLIAAESQGQEPMRNFALIILDQRLPKINGLDVLKKLHARGVTRAVPVVIFSTSTSASDRELALKFGARDYISKPVGYDEFSATIQKMTEYLTETNRQTA